MSTNIPPHNIREVVRAATHLLDHPDCTVDDLLVHIPGPDFPTGGVIVGRKGIRDAYVSGRGRVVVRARVKREQKRGGREQLVVTEIPYATSKTRILEQIADLVKKSRIEDISDLRDESDRDGIRMVIELKRGADPERVLEMLFKWTALQSTFGVISLALDGGVPREFSLKEILERFRDHRIDVVVRRSRWELDRARDEEHVLEGLLVALKHIDRVVQLIRSSRNRETASAKLQKEFKLTERQAEAILNMRLVRLTALERKDLQERLATLRVRILELEEILADPSRQLEVVRLELVGLGESYGDTRRTRIIEESAYTLEALEADEEVVVALSAQGFAKAVPMATHRRRSGAGHELVDTERYEGDYLRHAFVINTRDTLLVFTDDGRGYALAVGEIPEAGKGVRGRPLHQLLGYARGVRVAAVLPISRIAASTMLIFATRDGTIKRTVLDQFTALRAGGVVALTLQTGDRLVDVQASDGTGDVVLGTRKGRVIRFPEEEVTAVGRTAQGVKGIRLVSGDRVVALLSPRRASTICTVTERGFAKQTPIQDFSPQKRGGLGVVATPVARDTGSVILLREVVDGELLSLISNAGRSYQIPVDAIPVESPGSAGSQVVEPASGESLLDATITTARTRVAAVAEVEEIGDQTEPAEDEAASTNDDELEPANSPFSAEDQYDLLGRAGEEQAEDDS